MKAITITKTGLLALAAMLSVSCANEFDTHEDASAQGHISINARVGELTRAVTEGTQTTFEANDALSLYAWTGQANEVPQTFVVNGVVNTFDGEKWTPATTMLWKNVTEPHYFVARFPHQNITSFTQEEVTPNADLLVANVLGDGIIAPQTVTAPPVDLVFDHMMAKLNINVKYGNQWGGVPAGAFVSAQAANSGKLNYLTKTIVPGTSIGQKLEAQATPATGYDATYSALCIPQIGFRTLTFNIEGQTLVYNHATDIPLQAGKITNLTLAVGKDKISLIGSAVADWTEGIVNQNIEKASEVQFNTNRPLTVKAIQNGTTATFKNASNGFVRWIASDGRTRFIEPGESGIISLEAGQRVWFLGDGSNNSFSDGTTDGSSSIALNKDCEVYGNIMSLLGEDFATNTTLPSANTFAYLFKGETNLVNNVNEGIVLPAKELTEGCYKGLFSGCSSLQLVEIGATDISASGCLTEWVKDVPGASLGLISPIPSKFKMGDNLPWGATVYTQGTDGAEPVFTAPTASAANLTYNGTAQNLINSGMIHKDGYTLEYSTDGTNWSTSVASATNAGNYNVYCRLKKGEEAGVSSAAIAKNIAKAAPSVTAPTKKNNLTYNGSSQALVNAGSVTGGTLQFKVGSGAWTTTVPTQTNAGSWTVAWKVVGDANHTDVNETSLGSITIAKKAPSFSVNPTSVSFASTNAVNATKQVTITYDGDGELSVQSSNSTLVTATLSGKTVTITRKSGAGGSTTVTVSASAGTNYAQGTNQTISVSLTATDGKPLKDASVGNAVASNGLAYANKNNIPSNAEVIGMVAYKNGSNGLIMEKDWAGSKAYYKDEINKPATDNSSHAFGSAKLYTTGTSSKTTLYWFVGTKADYEKCGLTSQEGFNSVNTMRLAAGCEDLNSGRTYGTSDSWEFYGGTSTFWYNYWSNGSHTITLLISF